MDKFYIYLHKTPEGRPFYIGKGYNKRAYVKSHRSQYWKNIVKKYGYEIEFLEENLPESKALEREIFWIKKFGREDLKEGTLINFTNGGEGTIGRIVEEKTRRAVAEANKKRIASKQQREKVGNLFKGKTGSQHNRSKSVRCIETGIIYGSMSEAARVLKIDHTSVSWSVKHKKHIFGMHFEIAS